MPIEEKSPNLIQVGFKGGALKRQGAYSKTTTNIENSSPGKRDKCNKTDPDSVANGNGNSSPGKCDKRNKTDPNSVANGIGNMMALEGSADEEGRG